MGSSGIKAVVQRNEELVRFVIDQNANVKYQNEDGYTALMIAVEQGYVNIAKQIILKDATTLDQVNYKNLTPLEIAKEKKDANMITLLKRFQMQPEKTFWQKLRICQESCCANFRLL